MKIHHYGVVVRDIAEHYRLYIEHLLPSGYSEIIHDPLQRVNVAFINEHGGCIELVEPLGDESPVAKVLKKNLSLYHHICIEVPDLDEQIELCRKKAQIIVSPPKPAAAFDGRRIAFMMGRDGLLWELLET
jgi:methylmalonyl-CoA/ethylmalonyl-CoA epimerase